MMKRETSRARQGFEDYFAMGATRSLPKLHKIYEGTTQDTPTRSLDTLKIWSTSHNWPQRVKEREILVTEKTEKKVTDAVAEMRARHAALGYELQDKGIARLNELKLKDITTRDAITLVVEGAKLEIAARGAEAPALDISILLAQATSTGKVDQAQLSTAIFGRAMAVRGVIRGDTVEK